MALSSIGRSLLAFSVVVLSSCSSGYVKRGAALYAEGRYIEAADVFEKTEYLLEASDARGRAEYAAYRGLTLLGLGDLRHARRWLAYAYQIEQASPGSLRPNERKKLDAGWSELEERTARVSQPPSAPSTALAASQPPQPLETPEKSTDIPDAGP